DFPVLDGAICKTLQGALSGLLAVDSRAEFSEAPFQIGPCLSALVAVAFGKSVGPEKPECFGPDRVVVVLGRGTTRFSCLWRGGMGAVGRCSRSYLRHGRCDYSMDGPIPGTV